MTDKKLIVLDLNDVLWYKDNRNIKYKKGVHVFLEKCLKYGYVGFYSSTTKRNATNPLNILLKTHKKENILFRWFRKDCVPTPRPGKEYATTKSLKKVIEKFPKIKLKNVVIVDDELEKIYTNGQNNIVVTKGLDYDMIWLEILWRIID